MSVDKFRRILKILLSKHIQQNQDFWFLHWIPMQLCSKKDFQKYMAPAISKNVKEGLTQYYSTQDINENIEWVLKETLNFVVKKRHFYKAFEVITELVCKAYIAREKQKFKEELEWKFRNGQLKDKKNEHVVKTQKIAVDLIAEQTECFTVDEKELRVFKYQFILNYMSKPTIEGKIKYVHEIYEVTVSNSKQAVLEMLLPALRQKKTRNKMEGNVQVNRTSKFIAKELALMDQMLTGEYRFNKMQ